MMVFMKEGKPKKKKNSRSKARTHNKLNPNMALGWNRTQATLVKDERYHQCAIPALLFMSLCCYYVVMSGCTSFLCHYIFMLLCCYKRPCTSFSLGCYYVRMFTLHTQRLNDFLISLCSCCYIAMMSLCQDVYTANITR